MPKSTTFQPVSTTFRGHTIPILDLATLAGIHPSTLIARVKGKWNMDAAVFAKPADRVNHMTSDVFASRPDVKQFADQLEQKVITFLKKAKKTEKPLVDDYKLFGQFVDKDINIIRNVVAEVVDLVLQRLYK